MTAAKIARILKDDDFPWRKMAAEELDDDPAKWEMKLSDMRQRLESYQEKHPKFQPRADDGFLLAFLRTRKFNVKKAFDALVNYHCIRSPNPEMLIPRGKGPRDYLHIIRKGIVLVPSARNPVDGSVVIIVSLNKFRFEDEDISHVINIIYYLSRVVVRSVAFQTLGVRLIIDIDGVSMAFFTTLLRRFYNLKALIIAQGCFPARIKGVHVMNEYYGMVKHIYNLLWPFLSTKIRKRIHLHGSKYSELHASISPEILPHSLEGSPQGVEFAWFEKLIVEHHAEMVEDSYYGFLDF
ncbi:alpha-tocopherol transfer protein-like [Galendromus occidentalis]|uniref:Alpha-tocopherol transfer protein-like n=1 Tax=Galendromus occidentalis TaxID=34638 RepID=A0AAJ6VU30_9ACAR|nr:alpha-tocopherol transfer protein-like [Galendromus occidentalis]